MWLLTMCAGLTPGEAPQNTQTTVFAVEVWV